jgi:formate hydrogenlyase subunit 3/multisubunit Na+/H+ antiporter MnhD subunit
VILLAFLLIASTGTGATLALRYRPPLVAGVGLATLAACSLVALVMPTGETLAVGDAHLLVTPYARWFILAASGALLAAQVVGVAHGSPRNLPLAALAGVAVLAAAVTLTEPAAAMLAVTAASLAGVVATLGQPVSMPTLRVAADGLRLIALAGLLGLAGIALVGAVPASATPEVVGTAILAVGAAAAVRLGAVPLHIPTARLVETARVAAVPLAAAWLPAAFALVALGWVETTVTATGAATPVAHLVLAIVGALTIAIAGIVALLDDDLGRLLGYGLIADGGFVVLAAASSDPAAFAAARTWLICLGLSRTVMAAALLGLVGTFGTRRVRELDGWLRRMPLTGLALLAAALIGVGLPTMLPFEARRTLAVLALGDGLGLAALVLGALPLVGLARLARAGTRAPGLAVAAARGEWPLELPDASLPIPQRLVALWRLDRLPIASAVTLLLGLVALAAAVGVGDLAGAAAAPVPGS